MPETTTSEEQILEAVVAGPDGANRLFTVTGAANVQILASSNLDDPNPVNPTWTFLVGPTLTRGQLCRAIATASVASQEVSKRGVPSDYTVQIKSVEANWDDESERVEVRVELFLSTNRAIVNINQLRYWVTILAQI
jgi:hypothetical protein